jgi:hypothetical protein
MMKMTVVQEANRKIMRNPTRAYYGCQDLRQGNFTTVCPMLEIFKTQDFEDSEQSSSKEGVCVFLNNLPGQDETTVASASFLFLAIWSMNLHFDYSFI